ncbi:retropepsin-like aspartic protease [Pseudoalteromonas rubra]|uniref:Signal protein PDZ n=1 Tax=Pseudoalteromonas rubra TaxID=43658 RepID=A0A5S3WWL4_9GAMM|nr:retropepsin-like aspartic protease [Pseudoalteromonas rubra]TMP34751.1 signal protein PDZ [Pseudoalteromonas rubra]
MMMQKFLLSLFISLSFYSHANVSPWVDFELQNGHIKFPVTVEGKKGFAILDSGAQSNGINKHFINKHNLSLSTGERVWVKGVYSEEQRPTYNEVAVTLFGKESKMSYLLESSLGHHSNALLFGANFFRDFITQIDYPNNKIRLINKKVAKLHEFENVETQRHKGTGLPIVRLEVSGRAIWMLLDTGNAGGIIVKRSLAKSLGWLELESESHQSFGANSAGQMHSALADSVKFGPFELNNIQITYPAEGQKIHLLEQYQSGRSRIRGKRVQGIVGTSLLQHFLLTLDYERGHLHVDLPQTAD